MPPIAVIGLCRANVPIGPIVPGIPPAFLEDEDGEGSEWGWSDWDGVDLSDFRFLVDEGYRTVNESWGPTLNRSLRKLLGASVAAPLIRPLLYQVRNQADQDQVAPLDAG